MAFLLFWPVECERLLPGATSSKPDDSCVRMAQLDVRKIMLHSSLSSSRAKGFFLIRMACFLVLLTSSFLLLKKWFQRAQFIGPHVWSPISATCYWHRLPLGALKATVGDWGQTRRILTFGTKERVQCQRSVEWSSPVSMREIIWWHLTYAVNKEERKVKIWRENAPRKASLEYRVQLPFLYEFVVSFMELSCKNIEEPQHGASEEFDWIGPCN